VSLEDILPEKDEADELPTEKDEVDEIAETDEVDEIAETDESGVPVYEYKIYLQKKNALPHLIGTVTDLKEWHNVSITYDDDAQLVVA
jgi:hypothetical protein